MKEEINNQRATNGTDNVTSIIHKLTRKNLKLANNWYTWKETKYIQLDNYEKQETVGPHTNYQKMQTFSTSLYIYV